MLPYIRLSETDFEARWKLTEEEYQDFYANLTANNGRYVSFDKAEAFVQEWIKENR